MSVSTTVKSIQKIMRQDVGVDGDAQRISQLCWMFFLKIIDDQDKELEVLRDNYRSPIPRDLRWRNWAANPEGITGEELSNFVNETLFPRLKELPINTGPRAKVVRNVFEDAYNYMKSGQLLRQVINKINRIDFNSLAERQHFGDIYEQILNDLQSAGNAGEYYTPRAVTSFMTQMTDPKPGEILLDPACGTGGFLTCAINHMREHYVKRPKDEDKLQASLRAIEKKPLPHMLAVTNMLLHGIEDPSFLRHDNTLARSYFSYERNDRVDIVLTNPPFGGQEEHGIESNFPKHFQTRETADLFLALIIRILKPGGRAAVVLPHSLMEGEGVTTRLKEHLMDKCNLHTIVRLPKSVFSPYASVETNLLFFEKNGPTRSIWYWEHLIPKDQKAYSKTKPIRLEHLEDCANWWGGTKRQGREESEHAWRVGIEEIKARDYNLDIKTPHMIEQERGDPEVLLEKLNSAEASVASIRNELKRILTDVKISRFHARLAIDIMPLLTDRGDQVKYLRQTILNLAIQGKLVEQNSEDEPASKLLKQIESIINTTAQSRKIRTKKTPALKVHPFPIPENWYWARIREITSDRGQKIPDKPFTYIDVSAIDKETGVVSRPRVLKPNEAPSRARKIAHQGDVVYSCVRPYLLNVAVVEDDFNPPPIASTAFEILDGHGLVLPRYIWTALRSPFIIGCVQEKQRGQAYPAIKSTDFALLPFPLPPLAEQHRIITKVDELMALCNQLEESIATTDNARTRLLETLLRDTIASSANASA